MDLDAVSAHDEVALAAAGKAVFLAMVSSHKRIVGLSGSLRAGSSNAKLVKAAFRLTPPGTETIFSEGIASLPHFNPDLDHEGDVPLPTVAAFRTLLRSADAFIVSVPEYAHGLPGSFKSALDWLVSSGELAHKPVLVLNASAGGQHAQANLIETLTTVEAQVIPDSLLKPFLRKRLLPEGSLGEAETAVCCSAASWPCYRRSMKPPPQRLRGRPTPRDVPFREGSPKRARRGPAVVIIS